MKKNILLLTTVCILLEVARMVYSESLTYIFLIWNLFLAYIPYLIATNIQATRPTGMRLLVKSMLWLLFLPNALYIITDLKHLKIRPPIPEWYDSLLLFSYSTLALLFGLISFYYMNQVLKNYVSPKIQHLSILVLSITSGFGVYLGREERWNSWNLFTHPITLLHDCCTLITLPHVWAFSLCYGLAFLGMYHILSSLIHFNHEPSKQLA